MSIKTFFYRKKKSGESILPKDLLAVKSNEAINSILINIDELQAKIAKSENDIRHKPTNHDNLFVPNIEIANVPAFDIFMQYSSCSSADFYHPRFKEICSMINHKWQVHRKLWEWVFIINHLQKSGMLVKGKKGIVFGVGKERLPSLFAKLGTEIVATDAPKDIGATNGWSLNDEYSNSLKDLLYTNIVQEDTFNKKVSFRHCDMNNIDSDLMNFDFTWSSCCFEHLGSIENGIQFVINSVENILKSGGVACHTTEFNLSSNDETLETGGTVIYRLKDVYDLCNRLKSLGHKVEPIIIAPDSHVMDYYVDLPPYHHEPHLKMKIDKYVTTSIGIVITKK